MSVHSGLGILERDEINKSLSQDVADYKSVSLKKYGDSKKNSHAETLNFFSQVDPSGLRRNQRTSDGQHTVKFSDSSSTVVNEVDESNKSTYSMIMSSLFVSNHLAKKSDSSPLLSSYLVSLPKLQDQLKRRSPFSTKFFKGNSNHNKHKNFENLSDLVDLVFHEVPFENDQFLDELQYSIISSKFFSNKTNDDFKKLFSVPIKKSVLDFRKSTRSASGYSLSKHTNSNSNNTGIITKYGYIHIREKKLFLQKIITSYFKTHIFIYQKLKTFYKLSRKDRWKHKNLFICLMIQMYLNLQQESFHTKYIKYSTLLTIKSTIKSLENLNILLQRYENINKEMVMHNRLDYMNQPEEEQEQDNVSMQHLHILLKSTIYPIYQKFMKMLRNFVPYLNQTVVQEHCELFNVDLVCIYNYYKFVRIDQDLDYQMVCFRNLIKLCFISMMSFKTKENKYINTHNNEINVFFQNLFKNSDNDDEDIELFPYRNDIENLKMLRSTNHEIQKFIQPFHEILIEKRSLFFGTTMLNTYRDFSDRSNTNPESPVFDYSKIITQEDDQFLNQSHLIEDIMSRLNQVSTELIQSNNIKFNNPKFKSRINSSLQDLQSKWDVFIKCSEQHNTRENFKQGNTGTAVNKRNSLYKSHKREPSNGFQLNILDVNPMAPTNSYKNCSLKPLKSFVMEEQDRNDMFLSPNENQVRKLTSPINFRQVEDSVYIEDIFVDEKHPHDEKHFQYTDGNDVFVKPPGIDKFKTLSDEELRSKLNEKILKLGMENKLNKQKRFMDNQLQQNSDIRAQKSFGLLSTHHNSMINTGESKNHSMKLKNSQSTPYDLNMARKPSKMFKEESIPVLYELNKLLLNDI